jgi:hypothetical protein
MNSLFRYPMAIKSVFLSVRDIHGLSLQYVRGMTKKSVSGARAVTSDPSAAGRKFKQQSYKSHRHGCDSAMFDNIRFVYHRSTLT